MGKCLNCGNTQTYTAFIKPCNTTKSGTLSPCDFIKDTFFTINIGVNNNFNGFFVDVIWLLFDSSYIAEITNYPQTLILTDAENVIHTLNHVSNGMYVVGSNAGSIALTPDNVGVWNIAIPELSFILLNNVSCTRSDLEFELTVTIPSIGAPVIAIADSVSIESGSSALISVLDNDLFNNIIDLTLTIESNPVHGTVSIIGNNIEYTPNTGFCGKDSFLYRITDTIGQTSTAIVTIGVTCEDCPKNLGNLFITIAPEYTINGGFIYITAIKVLPNNANITALNDNGNLSYLQDANGNIISNTQYDPVADLYVLTTPVAYTGGVWAHVVTILPYFIGSQRCFALPATTTFSLDACQYFIAPSLSSVISNASLRALNGSLLGFSFEFIYPLRYVFEYSQDGGNTWNILNNNTYDLVYTEVEWSLYGFQLRSTRNLSTSSSFTCSDIQVLTNSDYTDTRSIVPIANIAWSVVDTRKIKANAFNNSFSYNPPIHTYRWNISLFYQGLLVENIQLQGNASSVITNIYYFDYIENGNTLTSAIKLTGTYEELIFSRSVTPLNTITIQVSLMIEDGNGISYPFTDQYMW